MTLTMTDFFCGAGGSSTGAIAVPGVEVKVAANHWKLAVDVHNANHQDAMHVQADISEYDPRLIPRTDIAWLSPSCTNHSIAQGKSRREIDAAPDLFGEVLPDAAAERSRATMWDVVRYSEYHRYRAVIVENVLEVMKWEPYRAWLLAMDSLGYSHEILSINSMHAQHAGLPAPQSRDRFYAVFWRKGDRAPDLDAVQRPQAWCPRCERVVESRKSWKNGRTAGRYRAQYVFVCGTARCGTLVEPGWLPAASAIDWTIPGQRIGDRAKPLAEKTRARIAAGIARYWRDPFLVERRHEYRTRDLASPFATITASGTERALAVPLHLEAAGNTYDATDPRHARHGDPNSYYRVWPTDDVFRTLHAAESKALAIPVEGREGKQAQPMTAPMRTQTTRLETAVVTPFVAELRGGGSDARTVADPLATVTASGNHHGLVTPYYGQSKTARGTGDPLGTLTTRDRYALIMRNNAGGSEMSTPVHEVMRTVTTAGHQSLITPGDIEAAKAQVDDCYFRMIEPSEAAAAMAFPSTYEWSGNRRERTRLAGNAVTPPAARDIVGAVAAALA